MAEPETADAPVRAWKKLDRFALFQLGRDHELSANACWVLASIALLAEWRSHSWCGTIGELAEDTRLKTRKATVAAIAELKGAGLVSMAKEFGPHRSGEVVLEAWDDLVVTSSGRGVARKRTAQISAVPDEPNRARTEHELSTNRARTEQLSSDPARFTSTNADLLGKEASRERGSLRGSVCSGGIGEDSEALEGENKSRPNEPNDGYEDDHGYEDDRGFVDWFSGQPPPIPCEP